MASNVRFADSTFTISSEGRSIRIEAAKVLRARMWNCSEWRDYCSDAFEARGVFPLQNGLRVLMVNDGEGLVAPVILRADEQGFRVIVQAAQIVETKGINRKLMALDVLPDLMRSRVGEAGFFLLPCLSGTLVRFVDHAPAVNRDRIYMDQSEWEKVNLMNCFAMKRGDDGILGIVHRGDFHCHVVTELNQDGENRIYPSFGLRHTEGEAIKPQDKEILYRFASGADADFPGLALTYRDYLLRERDVSPLKERVADNPVLGYSVGAMRVKIFMGSKLKVIDGNGPVRVDTTFEQAEAILDAMKSAGIDRAVVTLVGWNLGGHDGAYPTRFPIEPAFGGEAGLKKLIAKATDMGYQIVPHDNYTDVYRSARDFDYEYIARTPEGRPRVVGIWGGGQSFKACPVVYPERYGADFARVKELGFHGHTYIDAQSTVLWICHNPRHPADEEQFALAQSAMTQWHRAMYGAVATEMAPAYNLPFIDEVHGMHGANNSGFMFERLPASFTRIIDRVVPFYHLAVHGLLTYQESWVHSYRRQYDGATWPGLLRALAIGARPSMEVSWAGGGNGDTYSDSIRDVLPAYKIAFEELADVHVEPVVHFEEFADRGSRVAYANGRSVEVNWTDTPLGDLKPMSYRIQ